MLYGWIISLVQIVSLIGWGFLSSHILLKFSSDTAKPENSLLFQHYICKSEYRWQFFVIFLLGLVGLFTANLFALLWHFFLPVNTLSTIIFLIIGAVLSFYFFRNFLQKPRWTEVTLVFIVSFLISGYSVDNNIPGDSILYHITAVHWNKDQALVLGLANLHDRFGVNSTWFLVSALLNPPIDAPNYVDMSPGTITILVLCFLFCYIIAQTKNYFSHTIKLFFSLLLFSILFIWSKDKLFIGLGSPSNDLPAAMLFILICICWFLLFYTENILERSLLVSFSVLFYVLSFSFKFSQAAFIAPFLWMLWKFKGQLLKDKILVVTLLLSCGYFVLWLIRGLFLSGCWLFPLSSTCIDLPWTVPTHVADEIRFWIMSWARREVLPYYEVLKDSQWISYWLDKQSKTPLVQWTLGLICLGVICILFTFKKISDQNWKIFSWIFAGLGVYFAYWFKLAPDLRFASGAFICLISIVLWLGLSNLPTRVLKTAKIFFILGLMVITQDFVRISTSPLRSNLWAIQRFHEIPATTSEVSKWGVKYFKQVNDAEGYGGCAFAAMPCASQAQPDLKEDHWGPYRMYQTRQ